MQRTLIGSLDRDWAPVHHRLADVLLVAGAALVVLMLASGVVPWQMLAPRGLDAIIAIAVAAMFGVLAMRLLRTSAATGVLVSTAMASVAFAGPVAVGATVLVVVAAGATATLLPRSRGVGTLPRWVAGMGLLGAALGWLVPLPIHARPLWVFALLLVIVLRRDRLVADARSLQSEFSELVAQSRSGAAACACVVFLGTAPGWLPILNVDDLAYHANLASELLRYGHGRMDLGSQSWALAPWSTDALHALVSLLAGSVVAGPLNAVWLVATALLVVMIGRRLGLSVSRAWLAAMLYASLPLTAFLAGSMQTEAATPAILAAVALVILSDDGERDASLYLLAALAGFLMGAKIASGLLLLPMAVWVLVRWRRGFPWRALPLATVLGVIAGGSSYVYALALTGNPVEPMFNGFFRSPWYPPENFVDSTWQTGLHWDTLWRLASQTPAYFEGKPGAAGLAVLALAGGCVAGLGRPKVRGLLVAAIAAFVLVFWQVQYLRYVHPATVLLLPALLASVLPLAGRWGWREGLVAALVPLQLFLAPTASWMLADGALRFRVLEGSQAVMDRYVPERAVSARLRVLAGRSDRVLYVDPLRSHGGELPGLSMGTAWFTPLTGLMRAKAKGHPEAWGQIVESTGSNYVLAYDLPAWPDVSAYLASRDAVRVDMNGAAELYWLPPRPEAAKPSLAADGAWTVSMPILRPYPVIGRGQVRLQCSRPGARIAVSWAAAGAPAPGAFWQWITCRPGGTADSAVDYALPANAGPLVFRAIAVQPANGLQLSVLGAWPDIRRDLHRQTALADMMWQQVCAGPLCGEPVPAFVGAPTWPSPSEAASPPPAVQPDD